MALYPEHKAITKINSVSSHVFVLTMKQDDLQLPGGRGQGLCAEKRHNGRNDQDDSW